MSKEEQEDEADLSIITFGLGEYIKSYHDTRELRRLANEAIGSEFIAHFEWKGHRVRVERTNDGDGVDYLELYRERR